LIEVIKCAAGGAERGEREEEDQGELSHEAVRGVNR
jgi:hypothetical protein